ncbi:hypothetical protein QAD02_003452 [Eretmocerus hayati]|uniref:Uncharacterized protein n=1 Tax=Eretmocerus hayati TaxID=131215 RepID=A0ACC2NMU6_9HYME|nr:hypothetical protein QAD02_003452 [Eretmocerus hayati]
MERDNDEKEQTERVKYIYAKRPGMTGEEDKSGDGVKESTNPSIQANSGRGQSRRTGGEGIRIMLWNIAWIKNSTPKTWDHLKRYEIICLSETWLKKKEETWLDRKLGEYDITSIEASRQSWEGRPSEVTLATKKAL